MSHKTGFRVYVVEDDLELTAIMERVLIRLDPNVEIDWATSAEEAVVHLQELSYESPRRPFDLIVADVFLEGSETGLDLWRVCQESYPDIPLLMTSGLSAEKFLAGMNSQSICPPFLQKPFTIAECSQAFSELLNYRGLRGPSRPLTHESYNLAER